MKSTSHLENGVRPRLPAFVLVAVLLLAPFAAAEEEPLAQLWLERPSTDRYNGSPAFSAKLVWISNTKGELFGLDPKTGKTKVTAKVEGRTYGGLVATDDAVYVCGQAIRKVDADTGKVLWTHDFGAPCSREPAVDGNHVFAISNRGHMALLSAKTEQAVWRRQVKLNPERIALGGDAIIISASGQNPGLHVLDRKTGKPRWKAEFPGKLDGLRCIGFSIGRGVVYYGNAALRVSDGKPVWRMTRPARFWVTGSDTVVAVIGRRELVGLDPETGTEKWSWSVPPEVKGRNIPLREAPAVTGGRVVVAVEEGHITVLSARTGKVIATKRMKLESYDDIGQLHETPVVRDGRLIAVTTGGKTLASRFPGSEDAAWLGAHGGPGGWGQTFESDVTKLLSAEPPAVLTSLDPEKGQAELAAALRVEGSGDRVDALLDVIRQFDEKTLAGYRARRQACSLIETIELSLSLRNLPDVPIGITGVKSEKILAGLLEAEPIDPDTIDGLYDLDDVDLAEGLCSAYYGRRGFTLWKLKRLPVETRRPILVNRATKDPSGLVRAAAIEGLEDDTSEAAKGAVRSALADASTDVHRAAVSVIRSVLGDEEGRELLRQIATSDKEWMVKVLAKEKLKD